MCLGVPGKVLEIQKDEVLGIARGKVQFGGIVKEVNFSFTPDISIGDYVVVHVGFAISRLDQDQAQKVLAYLEEIDGLKELQVPEEQA